MFDFEFELFWWSCCCGGCVCGCLGIGFMTSVSMYLYSKFCVSFINGVLFVMCKLLMVCISVFVVVFVLLMWVMINFLKWSIKFIKIFKILRWSAACVADVVGSSRMLMYFWKYDMMLLLMSFCCRLGFFVNEIVLRIKLRLWVLICVISSASIG